MKVEARLKTQHPQDLVARMEAQHEKNSTAGGSTQDISKRIVPLTTSLS
jgi:hypothetical protein